MPSHQHFSSTEASASLSAGDVLGVIDEARHGR
jgi:hypothetical protein